MRRIATLIAITLLAFAVPAFAQEPDPEPSAAELLAVAVSALQDALTGAQVGQAGVDAAMAEQSAAEASLASAQARVDAAMAEHGSTSGNVVLSIDGLIEVLTALRAAHAADG